MGSLALKLGGAIHHRPQDAELQVFCTGVTDGRQRKKLSSTVWSHLERTTKEEETSTVNCRRYSLVLITPPIAVRAVVFRPRAIGVLLGSLNAVLEPSSISASTARFFVMLDLDGLNILEIRSIPRI